MCDKYILYLYTCLKRGTLQLTEDELSQMFGARKELFAQFDPKWMVMFAARCRLAYREQLKRSQFSATIAPTIHCKANRALTGEGTFTTVDGQGRVLQIENFTDPREPRKMGINESSFAMFLETVSVFENAAFRIQPGEAQASLSLVISRNADCHSDPSLGVSWHTCYTVKERDIRGLKVESEFIYTTDGLSLYTLVASWKTNVCLLFDVNCREEIVRTMCALALGDTNLGKEFKLKCVLPKRARTLDLRDLRPLKSESFSSEPCTAAWKPQARVHGKSSVRSPKVPRGLLSLRDVTRLPCGFSVVAENENVVALRHILRDAVVLVPKRRAAISRVFGHSGDFARESGEAPVPSGYITEWFPCGYSTCKIERGIRGVPPLMVSNCKLEQECDHTTACVDEIPTLRVVQSTDYHDFVPRTVRSRGHAFDQSVCLLPETMEIAAPHALHFPGCIAVMYAVCLFRALCLTQDQRATDPTKLLFMKNAGLREAQVILLSYLSLNESFAIPGESRFELTVSRHSVLSELRKMVSVNPRVRFPLADLEVTGREEAMREDMEDEILGFHEMPDKGHYNGRINTNEEDAGKSDGSDETDCEEDVRAHSGEDKRDYDCSSGGEQGEDAREEYRAMTLIASHGAPGVPRIATGHCVLFGHGGADSGFGFRSVVIGIRTLGMVNLNILRACGVFYAKHGSGRALLRLPNTKGVTPQPRWRGKSTSLTDDLCIITPKTKSIALPTPLLDCSDCYFQLNYSPQNKTSETPSLGHGLLGTRVEMSRIEQAICSENARGYEEERLSRLFKTSRGRMRECLFQVEIDSPQLSNPRCQHPHKRSWLSVQKETPGCSAQARSVIGDGEFFPRVEIANELDVERGHEEDTLSYPLSHYNLHLTVKSAPGCHSMARADRSPGECGSVYEACLDEAVLLGHCARVSVTRGAKRNFDVSSCLTWFYRSVHPCIPDMQVGDVMLDYEFTLHGRGRLSPVYAFLSHLAESCRVNCLARYKLLTLTRHRGASVWTRGTDAPLHSRRLRTNTVGAFLSAQDHRLAALLSRCCHPKPLEPREFHEKSELLPRGDEEELLLRAYSRTLGPAFEFERVKRFPTKVSTSLGEWAFMRLASRSSGVRRYPGTTVVDGYTVAFASESPLFYLRGEGPLVQKLESVAVIVDSSSLYRTDTLRSEAPEWPGPDRLNVPIKCRTKTAVIDEMFMRSGGRDPLEGFVKNQRSWPELAGALWTFKKAPVEACQSQDWELDYPLSESLYAIGVRNSSGATAKWLCCAPPASFSTRVSKDADSRAGHVFARIELDSRADRIRDPAAWQGFDALCSRVLACPAERTWSRGVCKVTNKGLSAFEREALVPIANLIAIVEPGEWYACRTDREAEKTANSSDSPEDKDLVQHSQVCSAPGFVEALASIMLSGKVHEEVEIRCPRRGLYEYIQRAVAWFAGATGPFRSRNVTVFTPECECDAQPWTHGLPPGLDVLKTSRTGYLVSCKDPDAGKHPVQRSLLRKSQGVICVGSLGNLVLHWNLTSLHLSRLHNEPGVHALLKMPLEQGDPEERLDQVYVDCDRSLLEFCKLRGIPKGIRGPETWTRPLPWSKHHPGVFCSKVSLLKFRWSSGTVAFTEAPVRDSGTSSWCPQPVQKWKRCFSDGKLIPNQARFWDSVDHKRSFARQSDWELAAYEESGTEPRSGTDSERSDAQSQNGSESGSETELENSDSEPVMVNCEWHESGVSSYLVLNSRLEIEFAHERPGNEGHVFFEAVHQNEQPCASAVLHEDGKLVKLYRPHKFRSLMSDIYTVTVYGCGLIPVFACGSSDVARNRVFNLAMGTLALADKISPEAHPRQPKAVIVVREGREEALKVARDISRSILVTRSSKRRAGAVAYAFQELPSTLERQASLPSRPNRARAVHYAAPEDFLRERGASAFARLAALWPRLLKRGDVKHPASSRDPRWIGLALCLAEWERRTEIADRLARGALEALRRTSV